MKRGTPRKKKSRVCKQCEAIALKTGKRCMKKASCHKTANSKYCHSHQNYNGIKKESIPKTDVPSAEFLKLYQVASMASTEIRYIESNIDHFCVNPQKIRNSEMYENFVEAFHKLTVQIEKCIKLFKSSCPKPGQFEIVHPFINEFENTRDSIINYIKIQCPKYEWTARPSLKGYITLTCNGKEMPLDVREWMNKTDDNLVEKTIFCEIPTALAKIMSMAGDYLLGVDNLIDVTKSNRIFKVGQKLNKTFKVYVVSGSFVGVARKKEKEDDDAYAWWKHSAKVVIQSMAKLYSALSYGVYNVLQCAVSAVQFLGNLTYEFISNNISLCIIGIATGMIASIPPHWWKFVSTYLQHGIMIMQLTLNPMAWLGAVAITASQVYKELGMDAAIMIYRQLSGMLKLLSNVSSCLTNIMGHLLRTVPHYGNTALSTEVTTRLVHIGTVMFTLDDSKTFATVLKQQIHFLHNAAIMVKNKITVASIVNAIKNASPLVLKQSSHVPLIAGPVQTIQTGISVYAQSPSNEIIGNALSLISLSWPVSKYESLTFLSNSVSLYSIGMCVISVSTPMGLVTCAPLLFKHLLSHNSKDIVELLGMFGVSTTVAESIISSIQGMSLLYSLSSLGQDIVGRQVDAGQQMMALLDPTKIKDVASEIGNHVHDVAENMAQVASGANEIAQNVAQHANQIIGRTPRITAAIGKCVSEAVAHGHMFLDGHTQLDTRTAIKYAQDPYVRECLARITNAMMD